MDEGAGRRTGRVRRVGRAVAVLTMLTSAVVGCRLAQDPATAGDTDGGVVVTRVAVDGPDSWEELGAVGGAEHTIVPGRHSGQLSATRWAEQLGCLRGYACTEQRLCESRDFARITLGRVRRI